MQGFARGDDNAALEQLDESLRQAGLPASREIFSLDFRGPDPVEAITEAEVVTEDVTAKEQ